MLAPSRSLPAEPDSVLTVVERLAVLQFDPLEVPGARNHDLVLHARIAGYRRGWCEQWLYGPDRRLFEIYNKSLNMVPIDELPHYRLTWTRYGEYYGGRILREHADVATEILAELERARTADDRRLRAALALDRLVVGADSGVAGDSRGALRQRSGGRFTS